MTDYEKKLLDNGFSYKDIDKLKSIIKNDESHKDTLQGLVLDLSKRFLGGIFCILIIFSVLLYGIYKGNEESFVSYAIVLVIALFIVYFVTPINLAWKAYKYIKKTND